MKWCEIIAMHQQSFKLQYTFVECNKWQRNGFTTTTTIATNTIINTFAVIASK